jgi:hypothetical protein
MSRFGTPAAGQDLKKKLAQQKKPKQLVIGI